MTEPVTPKQAQREGAESGVSYEGKSIMTTGRRHSLSITSFVASLVAAGSLLQGCIVSENLGSRADGGTDSSGNGDVDGGSLDSGNATLPAATKLVLFGGSDSNGRIFDDTWTFDGTAWTQINATGPSARSNPCFARSTNGVALFGGRDSDGNVLGDTWTFDGASWTKLDIPGPSPRSDAQCASRNGQIVLFGGMQSTSDGGPNTTLGDTWIFDGGAWTEIEGVQPPPTLGGAMAALGGKVVLYGGENDTTVSGDTWTFDGVMWTKFSGTSPEARIGSTMTELGDGLVMFGGRASPTFTETWAFDGTSWQNTDATPPDPRNYFGQSATLNGKVILLLAFQDGTFAYANGQGWSQLSFDGHPVVPSARGGEGLSEM
ncbi:MAG TPA: kelch repeat-containing protein [Polyangiaceae bacterium]